jgi:hypothetical protein
VALPGYDGNTGVGKPANLPYDGIVAQQRVAAGILQNQRLSRSYDLSAEGEGDRRYPPGRPGLRQAYGALEELAILGDERDERHWCAEQAGGHSGKAIEALLGWGIEERGAAECRQPVGAGKQTLSH